MSSSKIEEVGEARRSMNAVCGVDCLQFTDANLLLMFLPHSLCSYPQLTFIPLSRKRRLPYLRGAHPAMLPSFKAPPCFPHSRHRHASLIQSTAMFPSFKAPSCSPSFKAPSCSPSFKTPRCLPHSSPARSHQSWINPLPSYIPRVHPCGDFLFCR